MSKFTIGVNPITGEVGTLVPFEEGYVIRTKEQIDASRKYFDDQRNINAGRSVDFTFAAMEAVGEVAAVLTTSQCGYLLVLQCYIDFETNALKTAGRKSDMTTADMMDALKLCNKRSTFYSFLDACLKHDIIAQDEAGRYIVNPRYHFRGTTHDRTVIRSYTAKIRESYTSEKQAADLGLIYRMLPYVSYETNALCSNPTERDTAKVDWFTGQELAAAIGISESELSKRLRRLTVGDEYVIARITVGGCAKYMFNPLVFKRNKRPVDETIQAMFNVKYRGRRK